jgi:antirestriction protein ArdC
MTQQTISTTAQNEAPARKRDVYQSITDQIVAAIEAGAGAFTMPWHRDTGTTMPTNALTGSPYNGVNIVALWAAAEQAGFTTGHWATYKQWSLLGGQVRKGEKGSVVVFYKQTEIDVSGTAAGERQNKSVLVARSSRVFNVKQVDGWQPPRPVASNSVEVLVEAEQFVTVTSADIRFGGDRAYYRPKTDHIQMPDRDRFIGTKSIGATEGYYATLLHELTHWSGHKTRLDRDLSGRFGHESYAMEELVAELGAAFLCSDLGISNRPRPDHAAYIAHWLAVLKKDTRAIFTAASKANEARRFLAGLQPAP